MTNLFTSNFQAHPSHLASPSLWSLKTKHIIYNILFKRNYADSTDPSLTQLSTIEERSNSQRQALERQRDQIEQERSSSIREMDENMSEFDRYNQTVADIELDRRVGLNQEHMQQFLNKIELDRSRRTNLNDEESDIYEGSNLGTINNHVLLRQAEIDKERVRITAEITKSNKEFNDKNSTVGGHDVDRDYYMLLEKREHAEKAVLGSCDKHLAIMQKVVEIESQIRSLEDPADNGPASGNDAGNNAGNDEGSGDSNGPQASNDTGSLLDDYADPNQEQPSHMDSDD